MDAISGGASVIAFITIAAQSAKVIGNVIAGIKDGPENVARAGRTILMLQATLIQLAQCHELSQTTRSHIMETQIKHCHDDLAAFATRLSKLQLLDADSSSRRAWKRLKTIISEKELDMMTTVVGSHASILGLWLASAKR